MGPDARPRTGAWRGDVAACGMVNFTCRRVVAPENWPYHPSSMPVCRSPNPGGTSCVVSRSQLGEYFSTARSLVDRGPRTSREHDGLPSHEMTLRNRRNRRLFATTNTLDSAMAAPASMGLSSPRAATGMAATL